MKKFILRLLIGKKQPRLTHVIKSVHELAEKHGYTDNEDTVFVSVEYHSFRRSDPPKLSLKATIFKGGAVRSQQSGSTHEELLYKLKEHLSLLDGKKKNPIEDVLL